MCYRYTMPALNPAELGTFTPRIAVTVLLMTRVLLVDEAGLEPALLARRIYSPLGLPIFLLVRSSGAEGET